MVSAHPSARPGSHPGSCRFCLATAAGPPGTTHRSCSEIRAATSRFPSSLLLELRIRRRQQHQQACRRSRRAGHNGVPQYLRLRSRRQWRTISRCQQRGCCFLQCLIALQNPSGRCRRRGPTGRRRRWCSWRRGCGFPCRRVSAGRPRRSHRYGYSVAGGATLRRVSSWSSPAAIAVEDRLFRALAVLRVVVLAQRRRAEHLPGRQLPAPGGGRGLRRRDGAVDRLRHLGVRPTSGAAPSRSWPPTSALAVALLLVTPLVKGAGLQRQPARVLDHRRAVRLGDPLPAGRRAGRRARCSPPPTSPSARSIGQSDYGNAFLLVLGGADRRLHVRLAAADGHRARRRRTRRRRWRPSAPASRASSTTACCRSSPWSSGAAASWAARPPSSAGWPASRSASCASLIRAQEAVATVRRGRDRRPRRPSWPGWSGARPSPSRPRDRRSSCRPRRRHELVGRGPRLPRQRPRSTSGEDAPAWVLLQAFPDRVELSVRDDGPGIPAGRLEEAAAQGRLGVSRVDPRPDRRPRRHRRAGRPGSFGTEWEFVVPRSPPMPRVVAMSETEEPTRSG